MSPLTQLQMNVADILNGDAYFNDPDETKRIEVLVQRKGDLESEIAGKIQSIGISAVIITPLARLPDAAVGALELSVPLIVQVSEEPVNNDTGKPALDVVCEILALLHGAWTGIGNRRTQLIRVTETPVSLVDESPTYHCNFTAPVTILPRRVQPASDAPAPSTIEP